MAEGILGLTLSRACLSIGDCERFLSAERCVIVFDELFRRLCPESETYASACEHACVHSRDIDLVQWRLALLLVVSATSRAVIVDNKKGAVKLAERLRLDLNRKQWTRPLPSFDEYLAAHAKDLSLETDKDTQTVLSALASQPFNSVASAILCHLTSQSLWLKSMLDFTALTEVLAWDIERLTSTPPVAADDSTKIISAAFRALLDDSKVANRSTKARQAVEEIYFALVEAHAANRTLGQMVKCELDPGAISTFSKEIRARRLEDSVGKKALASLLILAETFHSYLRDFLVEEGDALKLKYPSEDVPIQTLSETPEAQAFCQLIPDPSVNLESVLAAHTQSRSEPATTSGDVNATVLMTIEISQKISAIVGSLISAAQMHLAKSNVAKIAAKKKNVVWSLKYGRGINEYVNEFEQIRSGDDVLNIIRKKDKLQSFLTAANQSQKKPKVAKGCVDFTPTEMRLREAIISRVTQVFKLYGAEPIDTPVFELKEILSGKYGEDQKLIYDLKDQGGELLGLRYDLTVPFARYCATNAVEKIKRYHIGKVYRRDEPQIAKGRLREFYQCDVDIAGAYDSMTAEAEILSMLIHLLRVLQPIIGKFQIKLSHRKLLDGMMEFAGVPKDKLRAISSAIDKLDKETWETVKAEMCGVKGLSPEVATKLEKLVNFAGPLESVASSLCAVEGFTENASAMEALSELRRLHQLLGDVAELDLVLQTNTSLARGLDYYTGVIYEAVLLDGDIPLGSIAAGGRYDNLIGMFSGKDIPAVGVSLGVERVFRMIEAKFNVDKYKLQSKAPMGQTAVTNKADVYICSIGNNAMDYKFKIAGILRSAGIRTEFSLNDKLKLNKQMQIILDQHIPFGVIFGEDEIARQVVKLREFNDSGKGEEIEVPLDRLSPTIIDLNRRRNLPSLETLLFAPDLSP